MGRRRHGVEIGHGDHLASSLRYSGRCEREQRQQPVAFAGWGGCGRRLEVDEGVESLVRFVPSTRTLDPKYREQSDWRLAGGGFKYQCGVRCDGR